MADGLYIWVKEQIQLLINITSKCLRIYEKIDYTKRGRSFEICNSEHSVIII